MWHDIYVISPTASVFVSVCCFVVSYCPRKDKKTEKSTHKYQTLLHGCVIQRKLASFANLQYSIQWARSASPDSCPNSAQLWRQRVETSSFYLRCQTEKHTALDKADLFSSAQTSHVLQSTMQNVHALTAQTLHLCSFYLYMKPGVCVCEIISAKIGKAAGITEMVRLFSVLQ